MATMSPLRHHMIEDMTVRRPGRLARVAANGS